MFYGQKVITRLPVHPCSDKVGENAMESSVNDETKDSGSMLNQANARPFSVIAKALHRTRS